MNTPGTADGREEGGFQASHVPRPTSHGPCGDSQETPQPKSPVGTGKRSEISSLPGSLGGEYTTGEARRREKLGSREGPSLQGRRRLRGRGAWLGDRGGTEGGVLARPGGPPTRRKPRERPEE